MTSRIVTIADALTTDLNGHSFSVSFTAVRRLRPRFTEEDLANLQVSIVPRRRSMMLDSRLPDLARDYQIDVAFHKRLAAENDNTETDPLLDLCEEVQEYVAKLKVSDAWCVDTASPVDDDALWAEEMLRTGIFLWGVHGHLPGDSLMALPMFGLSFHAAKGNFFDRLAVTSAVDKARAKVLSKCGAFVMRRARSSIRRPGANRAAPKIRDAKGRLVFQRLRASKPGSPPFSQTGLLRKFILFRYDRGSRSVVVGPTLLNKPTGAPEVLEYGGTVKAPSWWKRDGKPVRTVTIAPRPYMRPALAQEAPKFPAFWKHSVTRAA